MSTVLRILITTCVAALICAAPSAYAQQPPSTDGWVVLGIDDYRALRARAYPTPRAPCRRHSMPRLLGLTTTCA